MAEVLTYSQGQTATLTADFVTSPQGQPVDVPDAQIRIIGSGGSSILDLTAMTHLYTGFYYFDWTIPNSLPVNTYTVVISGTVDGITTSMSAYIAVLEAGSPTVGALTQREVGLIDALNVYINPTNNIPIYNELARRNRTFDVYKFAFPRWNLGNHEIRRNGVIIENGFTLNLENGSVVFNKPQHPSDEIEASYNFRYFSTVAMRRFLSDAANDINIEVPATVYSLDSVPDNYVGTLLKGAVANAMKQLILSLSFQEPELVFGSPERAKSAIENFKTLKENNEKTFAESKKLLKRGRWARPASVVNPEYTLPGGRARWFRYLFSGSV